MLNNSQKDSLRHTQLYSFSIHEKNGKAVDCFNKPFVIPSWSVLRENAYTTILKHNCFEGLEKIPSIMPEKANCIIRLFQKQHYTFETDIIFNLYGFLCFVKNSDGKWTALRDLLGSECDNTQLEIDFSRYTITNFLWHECISIETDFFDVFVKVIPKA